MRRSRRSPASPPRRLGVMLDNAANRSARTRRKSTSRRSRLKAMPLANLTNMTDAERAAGRAPGSKPAQTQETHHERTQTQLTRLDRRALRRAKSAFCRQVVRIPTDTPPGNNAPHAEAGGATCCEAYRLAGREARGASAAGARLRHGEHHQPDRAPAVWRRAGRPWRSMRMATWCRRARAGPIRRMAAVIEDGYMYGRATAVSKSDFATYMFAVRALEALGVPLQGRRRTALHLRRGIRRPAGAGLAAGTEADASPTS